MGDVISLEQRLATSKQLEQDQKCTLCALERQGITARGLSLKLEAMQNYLSSHVPNENSALAMKITRETSASNLPTLARLTMNWGANDNNEDPLYTRILSFYTDRKLREAQTEHLMHNPPPPDMI